MFLLPTPWCFFGTDLLLLNLLINRSGWDFFNKKMQKSLSPLNLFSSELERVNSNVEALILLLEFCYNFPGLPKP